MSYWMIKMDFYGGDADIDLDGFVVLTDHQRNAFKELYEPVITRCLNAASRYDPFFIHVDCDDQLPCVIRDRKKFDDIFTEIEITEDEFKVLHKLLMKPGMETQVLSYGDTQPFDLIWDSTEFYEKYPIMG